MFAKSLKVIALLLFGLALAGGTGCTVKAKKARALQRADRHFQDGRYEQARLEYMNVLLLDRQDYKALSTIGKIYAERGQVLSALPFLRAARKLETNDLSVATVLGFAYLAIFDPQKARDEANYVLEKNPGFEDAVLLLAETVQKTDDIAMIRKQILELQSRAGRKACFNVALSNLALKENNATEAEKLLTEALKLDPNSASALVAMGNIHLSRGEMEAADRLFTTAANFAPIRSSQQLRRVDLKVLTGATAEAVKILKTITDKVPDHVPALVYESKIAFADQKYEECMKMNQKIIALDRINYDALLLDGRSKLAQKKTAEAIKDFEKMRSFYTKSPELLYYIGMAHLVADEIDRAVVSLTQAATFEPNFDPAAVLLAELYLRQGNPIAAVQLLLPIIRKYPTQPRPYLLLANAYWHQDRYDSMIETYKSMLPHFPNDPEPPFQMGLTYRQQKKPAEAREQFLKARELDPKNLQALNQLVEMDVLETNYTAAWKRVDGDLAQNPQSPDLHFLAAKIYLAQQEIPKSEAALQKALEINPAYQPAYSALADIYALTDKLQLGLTKLLEGIGRNPKDLFSMLKAGSFYEKMNDYPNAAKIYEQALAVDPKLIPALNNLAYIYSERMGQNERAYSLAQRAHSFRPADPAIADTLGWILYKRGDYVAALKLLQECVDKLPNEADVLYHAGMAYYMTGAETSAKSLLARAVAAKESFPGREEAVARLAVLNMDDSQADAPAVAQLQAVLEKQPKDLIVLLRLAAVHARMGQNEKARLTYENALQINPKSVTALVNLAELYAKKLQNQPKAIELAKAARELSPNDPQAIALLGPLAFQARDHALALSLLQDENRRNPGQVSTMHYLGLTYFYLGKIAEAENTLRSVLSAAPQSPQAEAVQQYLTIFSLASNPAQAVAAEATVAEALKKEPDYLPALLVTGVIQEEKGKFAEARQTYEKILARYPAFSPAIKRLGILCVEQYPAEAKTKEWLTKALEATPGDLEVIRALGMLAFQRADYRYAAQMLGDVAAKNQTDASLLFHLGLSQYHSKQKAESKATLQQALALNDKDKMAEEARRILEEIK